MDNFEKLGIIPELIQGIETLGIIKPMPIQAETIPVMLENKSDLIGLAQTGTGKTAAFGLPLIQRADLNSKQIQSLILSPTRELAIQIANDIKNYAKHLDGFKVVAVYGGAPIDAQIRDLKKNPQIVVATPGRLLDLIRRRKLNISNINSVVLDEADEMLNMGFEEDLNAILSETPDSKFTYLFSATMPHEVTKISKKYMNDPVEITVGNKNAGAENVSHIYSMVQAKHRYLALKRICDFNPDIYGIIFCRTRMETKDVAEKLMGDGYNADALHGDLSQAQRDYVMQRFRNKTLNMIVATDVAARGLDVDDLSHVINYNLPDELSIYTHRSGRTGRAGKKGISIVIIHQKEKYKISRMEKIIGKKFEVQKIPDGRSICGKQLFSFINKMEKVEVDEAEIAPYIDRISKKLDGMDKEQLIKKFVSLEFNRFLSYYKDAQDLNASESRSSRDSQSFNEKRKKNKGKSGGKFSRFHIKVGSRDKISPIDLIGMINDNTKNKMIEIGKIEILKSFTFFEVEEKSADLVIQSFQNAEFKGRKLGIEKASPKKASKRPDRDSKRMDRDSKRPDRDKKRKTESFSNEDRPKKNKERKDRKKYSSHKK